jgi:hypothetical protein
MKIARLFLCLAAAATAIGQDPKQTGPTTLVITYRCLPAQRVQLRQQMEKTGLARFQHWKEEAILADYHILFSRYVDTDAWDMMAVLSFPTYAEVEKWKRIERLYPAGLIGEALSNVAAINSYPADLVRQGSASEVPAQPVFLVIPYEVQVAAPAYLQYVDDYAKPQLDGWITEGVLARYAIVMQRYTAARPWDCLIVMEYKDDASLGEREKVAAKVKARLMSNAAFAGADENKENVRVQRQAVVADELVLGR